MKRLDRRTFTLLVSVGGTGAILTACGNDPDDVDLNPTMITVEGAPPTLAPNASPASEAVEDSGEEAGGQSTGGGGTTATVTAIDLGFDPKELTVAADTDVTITLVNNGVLEHDLAIEDTEFETELIGGGESVDLVVNLPAGDYTYYCTVAGHRDAGMEGTLHVVEGGGEEATAEEEEAPAGEEAAAGDGGGAATTGEVSAFDLGFDPKELTVAADTDVTITLVNNGVLEHDLAIEDTEFETELIGGGESVDLVVNLPAGDYTYYCTVAGHRDAGMEGTLHVVAGGGGEAAAADEGTGEENESSPAAGGELEAVTVEAVDPFQWSVGELSVAPGQVIHVVNTGLLEHDFVVDELNIDAPLPIGETVDVTVPADATVGDTYEFYCSVAGHRSSGMKGTITIVEAPTGQEEQGGPSEAVDVATPEVGSDIQALMDDPEVVALEATDPYNWSWKAIEAYPGQIIRVVNLGVLEHDFAIDELDIEQALPFGEPIDIQVPTTVEPGDTFLYYCTIPGHRELGMEGTLTIIEEGATASPVAADGATPVAKAATPAASPAAETGGGAGPEVAVSAIDLAFDPKEIEIPANTDVTLTLTNNGVLEHDLAIDDLGLETDLLSGGESQSITVNAAPGTYEFHCTVAGHADAGMKGTLTVV